MYKYVNLYVPVHTCVFRGQVMADLGLGTSITGHVHGM